MGNGHKVESFCNFAAEKTRRVALEQCFGCTRAKPGTFEEENYAVLDQHHAYPLSCTCRVDTRNHIFPQHEIERRTSDTGVPS
jgi:hypothetical protein